MPTSERILEVFDESVGQLLILGEPGSGKTTVLLELTGRLLERAERDPAQPIPIVFRLESWAESRSDLTRWMVDELARPLYKLPAASAREWLEGERVLPLLDGLDEVPAAHRADCVSAINAYLAAGSSAFPSIAVTSRLVEYEALSRQLQVRSAVLLQPLADEQIDGYLAAGGDRLAGVRAALDADATLREMASSPLLLSTMALAYTDVGADELPTSGSVEARRRRLFQAYVERMLGARESRRSYPKAETLRCLGWLAKSLAHRARSALYVESLQADWLSSARARLVYTLLDRVGSGATFGLVLALLAGLAGNPAGVVYAALAGVVLGAIIGGANLRQTRSDARPWPVLRDVGAAWCLLEMLAICVLAAMFGNSELVSIAAVTLALGLPSGAVLAIVVALARTRERRPGNYLRVIVRRLPAFAVLGIFGVAFVSTNFEALVIGTFGTADPSLTLAGDSNLVSAVLAGGGVPAAVAAALAGGPAIGPRHISSVEKIGWSRARATSTSRIGLVIGFALAAALALLVALIGWVWVGRGLPGFVLLWLGSLLVIGVPTAIMASFIFNILGGLSVGELDLKLVPNQGIRRSGRSAVSACLLATALLLVVTGAVFEPAGALRSPLLVAGVPTLALAVGLGLGGYAWISHHALRLVLWRGGLLPLRSVDFLEFATERILLRRVGGGYTFVHKLVQDYFAGL